MPLSMFISFYKIFYKNHTRVKLLMQLQKRFFKTSYSYLFCFVYHWKGKSHLKLHHTNVLFFSLSFCCFYFAMFTQKSASSCLIFIKITKVTLISISNLLSLNVLLSFDSLLLYIDFDFNNKDIFLYFV